MALVLGLVAICAVAKAQVQPLAKPEPERKNIAKLGWLARNDYTKYYCLGYERWLTKRWSMQFTTTYFARKGQAGYSNYWDFHVLIQPRFFILKHQKQTLSGIFLSPMVGFENERWRRKDPNFVAVKENVATIGGSFGAQWIFKERISLHAEGGLQMQIIRSDRVFGASGQVLSVQRNLIGSSLYATIQIGYLL